MSEIAGLEKSEFAQHIDLIKKEEEKEKDQPYQKPRHDQYEATQRRRHEEKIDLREKAKRIFIWVLCAVCALWLLSYIFRIVAIRSGVEDFGLTELTTEVIRALLPILPLILGYLYGSKENN